MSGRQPPERPTIEGYVTPSDVADELNFVEWLRAEVSGTDDYLEAMLENQRLMLMNMMQQMQANSGRSQPVDAIELASDGSPSGYDVSQRPVPRNELINEAMVPLDAVGLANRTIYENDIGPATFQVNGTIFATTVRVAQDIASGDPLRVVAPGNIVRPVNDVALSLLGLPGSVGGGTFEVDETDENVTLSPGETKYVIRSGVASAEWVATGTNDETYSLYQYTIDGQEIFEDPLKEPLGLYNDPYRFPSPLAADQSIGVKVTRTSDASGSADYYSKVTYFD